MPILQVIIAWIDGTKANLFYQVDFGLPMVGIARSVQVADIPETIDDFMVAEDLIPSRAVSYNY